MKKNERIWSEIDLLFLKENYKKNGVKYCSEILNRTIMAIRRRANLIGVSNLYSRLIFDENVFFDVIKKSRSIKEVLLKLKLRPAGGNYNTIKKYIKKLNIDTSHFLTKKDIINDVNIRFIKRPIQYYLVEHNTTSAAGTKRRLFDEGYFERKCILCGQGEVWMGKKISLILDHKNGNHYDWRLENLQIVCPNCNATLDTHCGKNVSKRNVELKTLGFDINKKTDLRKSSKNKFITPKQLAFQTRIRKKERPHLNVLIKDVSELGYVGTGKKYGVSDNSIRKWIKQYKKTSE
jgi:hypothetical protein